MTLRRKAIDIQTQAILRTRGHTVGDPASGNLATMVEGPLYSNGDRAVEPLTDEETTFLAAQAGAIIWESRSGSMTIQYFATTEGLASHWGAVVRYYEADDSVAAIGGPDGLDSIDTA